MNKFFPRFISGFLILSLLSQNLLFLPLASAQDSLQALGGDKKIFSNRTKSIQWKLPGDVTKAELRALNTKIDNIRKNAVKNQKIQKLVSEYRLENQSDIDASKFSPVTKKTGGKTKLDSAKQKRKIQKLQDINASLKTELDTQLKQGLTPAEAATVTFAEPNFLYEPQGIPNDSRFAEQWGLKRVIGGQDIPQTSGNKVVVAVVDTGIDFSHPELQSGKWTSNSCVDENGVAIPGGCPNGGYDFVDNDSNPYPSDNYTHGTAVAGIIGAETNNNQGVASLGGGSVQIMALRSCCSVDGFFEADSIARAIMFAANNNAQIINMSFGGPTYSESIKNAIDYARSKGILVITAAGNYSSDNDQTPIYPASYQLDNILRVAAIDDYGKLASFSNYGRTTIDIAAPGTNILTTTPLGSYQALDGTSFSTPLVVSVGARILSDYPGLSLPDLKTRLLQNSIFNAQLTNTVVQGRELVLKGTTVAPVDTTQTGTTTASGTTDTSNTTGNTTATGSSLLNPLKPSMSYREVMKVLNAYRSGDKNVKHGEVVSMLTKFVGEEKTHFQGLGLTDVKTSAYISFLEQELVSLKKKQIAPLDATKDKKSVKMLDGMSPFSFDKRDVKTARFSKTVISLQKNQNKPTQSKLQGVQYIAAQAVSPTDLPVVENLQSDNEVLIDSEIQKLASDLEHNPVKIFNYVYNHITYEPYYGAKKGSLGCLHEKVCNDYDSSSLIIALLRASGIPARYQKQMSLFSTAQLKSLLGVQDVRAAFGALYNGKVPIFSVSGVNYTSTNLENINFSAETHFAIEWVHAQAFLDYDHEGANKSITLGLPTDTNTNLQSALAKTPGMQWINVDGVIKQNTSDRKEILVDTASFNTQNFWEGYLQYAGSLSPLEKYKSDLQAVTTKSVDDNLSTKSISQINFDALPLKLPYYLIASAQDSNGTVYVPSSFSAISDNDRQKVVITLKKEINSSTLLSTTLPASEVNNLELELAYKGKTQTDENIITQYGGIHLTPSQLVDVVPYIASEKNSTETQTGTKIGEGLILQFDLLIRGENVYTSKKFSTAGNREGIFMSFSRVTDDLNLDTNAKTLLSGNAAMARKYLKRIQDESDIIGQSLDYKSEVHFIRAVVTQNRVLNKVSGTPTSFDFKGLTLDAASFINDYSRRSDFSTHTKDFRLLFGLEASYNEGQIFKDIAGLEGISTVKGLQYAYNHPIDYQVLKITSANKTTIDSLQLSDTTKNNMRSDVDKGNTIITPNKIVQDNSWQGLFYISLDPQWTGNYAIGEQAMANGGWTIDQLQEAIDGSFQKYTGVGIYRFISTLFGDMQGWISEASFNAILATKNDATLPDNERWKEEYGYPLYEFDLSNNSGNIQSQNYSIQANAGKGKLTTKYVNFGQGDGYESSSSIAALFETKYGFKSGSSQYYNVVGADLPNLVLVKSKAGIVGFDSRFNTYVYDASIYIQSGGNNPYIRILAIYNPKKKDIFQINQAKYDKYVSEKKINGEFVYNRLGFPTSDSKLVGGAFARSSFQEFEFGNLYERPVWYIGGSPDIYAVYGDWKGTMLGFGISTTGLPTSDVRPNGDNYEQVFDNYLCTKRNGIISCNERTGWGDFKDGVVANFEQIGAMIGFLDLQNLQLSINESQKFVDYINNGGSDRKELCEMFLDQVNGQSVEGRFGSASETNSPFRCVWPNSVSDYYNHKADVQKYINDTKVRIIPLRQAALERLMQRIESESDEGYTISKWAGFFAIDIAMLLMDAAPTLVAKISTLELKDFSIRLAIRFSEELTGPNVPRMSLKGGLNRSGFIWIFNPFFKESAKKAGADLSEEGVEELVKTGVKRAGVRQFAEKNFTFGSANEFERFVVEGELGSSLETARKIDSITGSKAYRLVDGKATGKIIEAKSGYATSSISKSQLTDYLLYGQKNGYKIEYYFRTLEGAKNNKSIFQAMLKDDRVAEFVRNGGIKVYNYDAKGVKALFKF